MLYEQDNHLGVVAGEMWELTVPSNYEPVVLKLQLYMALNLSREAEQQSPMDGVARHRKLLDVVADGRLDRVLAELGDHGARRFLS